MALSPDVNDMSYFNSIVAGASLRGSMHDVTFECAGSACYFFTSFFADASSFIALVFFDITSIDGFDYPYLVTPSQAVTSWRTRILPVDVGARLLGAQVEHHDGQSPSHSVL